MAVERLKNRLINVRMRDMQVAPMENESKDCMWDTPDFPEA